jgi:hypothetical protein
MNIRNGLIFALTLATSPSLLAAPACGIPPDGRTQGCPIDLADGDYKCPLDSGLMVVQRLPGTPVCEMSVNEPVAVMSECYPAQGGMLCEGWGQEVSVPARYLSYSWSVRVGFQVTQYQTGTYPYVNFSCNNGQSVAVTMIVTNGTYSASTQQSYTCGDIIE